MPGYISFQICRPRNYAMQERRKSNKNRSISRAAGDAIPGKGTLISRADDSVGRTHPVCAAVTPVSEGVSHCP